MDIGDPAQIAKLPAADLVYLVAAIPSFVHCEADPRGTWRVNADAPVALARYYRSAFVVFVSSDAVEFCGKTEYGRQKAYVESILLAWDHVAVVRPTRISREVAPKVADYMLGVAMNRRPGLYRWS